jgi:hypothetical protein
MSDNTTGQSAAAGKKQEQTIDLRPTLFIGVGGTGMEVLLRVRRKILGTLWNGQHGRTRVESLTDFPVAQFLHMDLDAGAVIDGGRAQAEDLQYPLVKFQEDERLVESFDLEKYSRDDDALEKYPHIKEWLTLTPQKIRELKIDPGKGAGQVRSVSRLYLFDKYAKLRDKIRLKLRTLKAGLDHREALDELGLRFEPGKFRVVVVASVAGGTGSGAFIDMGYLARWLAKTDLGSDDVELMLFMPTGYAAHNKDRTEANGYSALMELEAAMMGNKGYVGRWDTYDQPTLHREPYSEVYLIDSGNLAAQHTQNVNDVYQMVADALFEDFASGDFSRRKRSTAVNQAQFKNLPHDALVPRHRFPDMRLSYSKRYSAFGQSTIDTRLEAKLDERAHRWAGEMLKAFFGVGGSDQAANRATDAQRDTFLVAHAGMKAVPFSEFPEFSDRSIELKHSSGEFLEYQVTEDLLSDQHGSLLAGVEQRVSVRIDEIRSGFERDEWVTQIREAVKQMERDAVRDQDSTADTTEDRVVKRRRELLDHIKKAIRDQLYTYLDNKEFGGLEYVLSLVDQVKDRLEAPGIGLIHALQVNEERYREIKNAVRSREYERLLDNLAQTRRSLFSSNEKQANTVLDQLRTEIANALKFHLRAKAAGEAAELMKELSAWLGRKTGIDAQGRPVWSGLVGEFQAGRAAVLEMLTQLQGTGTILRQDLSREHSMLITVDASAPEVPMPGAAQLREWADEAFKDLGGSKVLFPMLGDVEQRRTIITKVKRMAERQLALRSAIEADQDDPEPLISALEAMSPAQRKEIFGKFLACAMPWVDGNLAGDFKLISDQYKCFIGVANANLFSAKFGEDIKACVPTPAGITTGQVSIVETGVPGRAVCYTELSGIPLTIMRGIDGWRTSYRKEESERIPTHAHIDSTQFNHPIAPTTEEINRLAEDFKKFIVAIMLGALTRSGQRLVPPGQYQFAVARGDVRRIGNERSIRLNGLPPTYADAITTRVQDLLADFDGNQLAALATLCAYYETTVYKPRLVTDANGTQLVRQGFASAVSAEAKREMRERARRRGMADAELDRIENLLLDKLGQWATVIGDSDADAYDWEVREPGDDGLPRLKYAMRADMLVQGAFDALVKTQPQHAPMHAGIVVGQMGQTAGFGAGVPPPPPGAIPMPGLGLPQVNHQYFLAVGGQQYGPYNRQQILDGVRLGQIQPATTHVWREGLSGWLSLHELAELGAGAPPMPPAMPPLPPAQG